MGTSICFIFWSQNSINVVPKWQIQNILPILKQNCRGLGVKYPMKTELQKTDSDPQGSDLSSTIFWIVIKKIKDCLMKADFILVIYSCLDTCWCKYIQRNLQVTINKTVALWDSKTSYLHQQDQFHSLLSSTRLCLLFPLAWLPQYSLHISNLFSGYYVQKVPELGQVSEVRS